MPELDDRDQRLAAVTHGEHHDDRHEDGGDGEIPLDSLRGVDHGSLLLDLDVDAEIQPK